MKQAVPPGDFVWQLAPGLSVVTLIGLLAHELTRRIGSPLADPLIVAMIAGIVVRTAIRGGERLRRGFMAAPLVCIPAGIAFYAVKNLNFAAFAEIRPSSMTLVVLIMAAYLATVLVLGKCLGQKAQISCLTAAGSAICGASAIAITSPAVKADHDDISVSLLAVTVAAIVALFTLLPFVATTLGMGDRSYGLLCGSVLQMTGFVKAAVYNLPFLSPQLSTADLASLALSVKAVRYLGLLVAIPLFASLVQRRLYVPWVLWVFLAAGLLGTWLYVTHRPFYVGTLIPWVEPFYRISWSMAMAAVGLNADVRQLLSDRGAKALIMAFAGCAAVATFFVGSAVIGSV